MLKKKLLKMTFLLGGFGPFHLSSRNKLLVLTYHRFSRAGHPCRVTASQFRAHLNYLRKHVTVISLSKAVRGIAGELQLPTNATVITIDDGYHDAYEIAFPILKEFQFPATLFAVTEFVNGGSWIWTDYLRFIVLANGAGGKRFEWQGQSYDLSCMTLASKLQLADTVNSKLKEMSVFDRSQCISDIAKQRSITLPDRPPSEYAAATIGQLREMDTSNLRIESHTATHPILTRIAQVDLKAELEASRSFLGNVLNRDIRFFCYPNGNVSDKVRMAVEKAGYTAAVTTEFGLNATYTDPFMLRRIDSPSSIESFAQYASGFESFRQRVRRPVKSKSSNKSYNYAK